MYSKNTIYKEITVALNKDYFDYLTPPSVFSLAEKDEDDRIPLKVITKKKISHDAY